MAAWFYILGVESLFMCPFKTTIMNVALETSPGRSKTRKLPEDSEKAGKIA